MTRMHKRNKKRNKEIGMNSSRTRNSHDLRDADHSDDILLRSAESILAKYMTPRTPESDDA